MKNTEKLILSLLGGVYIALFSIQAYGYVSQDFNGYETNREYNQIEYYTAQFKTNSLGKYEFSIDAYEIPSNEWLPIIDSSYFKTASWADHTEVDNLPPSATYSAQGVVKVDVVFATGELSQTNQLQDYIDDFEAILNSSSNNIDAYVERVETSTFDMNNMSADTILNTWINYLGSQYGSNHQAGWTILNGNTLGATTNVNWTGFWSKLYLNTTDSVFEFVANVGSHQDPQGWTFRMTESGGVYSFYALEINHMYGRINLARIDNWQPGSYDTHGGPLYHGMINGQDGTYGGGTGQAPSYQGAVGEFLASAPCELRENGGQMQVKIEVKGNNIKVYTGGKAQPSINYTDNSPKALKIGSFGPYTCSQYTSSFGNIYVEMGASKSLGEAIQDVSWRDGSVRFVVHATDVIPQEGDPKNPDRDADFAYTVAKLLNSNTYLINLGNNVNKASLDKLLEAIRESNGTEKGIFYQNKSPNIIKAMNDSAQYIIDTAKKFSKAVDWVLVNTEIKWNTIYKDPEKDPPLNLGEHNGKNAQPQDISDIALGQSYGLGNAGEVLRFTEEKILTEKWRYRHYNNFFDNSTIQVSYHTIWIEDPVSIFEYPGKYRINYKRRDNPLYPNIELTDAFDSYRYWSTDYDYKTSSD